MCYRNSRHFASIQSSAGYDSPLIHHTPVHVTLKKAAHHDVLEILKLAFRGFKFIHPFLRCHALLFRNYNSSRRGNTLLTYAFDELENFGLKFKICKGLINLLFRRRRSRKFGVDFLSVALNRAYLTYINFHAARFFWKADRRLFLAVLCHFQILRELDVVSGVPDWQLLFLQLIKSINVRILSENDIQYALI